MEDPWLTARKQRLDQLLRAATRADTALTTYLRALATRLLHHQRTAIPTQVMHGPHLALFNALLDLVGGWFPDYYPPAVASTKAKEAETIAVLQHQLDRLLDVLPFQTGTTLYALIQTLIQPQPARPTRSLKVKKVS